LRFSERSRMFMQ